MDARPRLIAALAAHFSDLDLAEEAFDAALAVCLTQGDPPDHIAGWLMSVARRKGIDIIRKRSAEFRAGDAAALIKEGAMDMGEVIALPDPIPDERLRLLFICCHPAIALETRAALALKIICGLPVCTIARLFLIGEPAMFQRITRAKAKVREAGIPFDLPERRDWPERLDAILLTLELAYTAAYQDAAGELDAELSAEIGRLAAMIADLFPEEPEALGLAALITLARSRETERIGQDGAMIPLSKQDPVLWNRQAIEQARAWLDMAMIKQQTGPYQIMAAIQLTHARRAFHGETDWRAIASLYDALMMVRPGPVVHVNRALAIAECKGAELGLAELDAVDANRLSNARPYYVARAKLLERAGENEAAIKALDSALKFEPPRAERLFLQKWRDALTLI
ncbi:RNA polymerase sigma factor [Erythrobacter crassostreae]|uniref:RNA polymerase subunit sigma-24 n=1 Tax=Erythrobacter crassostreae TaxID=2828328 RepID=A0A9X1F4P7_9SPHN|nr:DUF6596 domain-containing protein [Erythrobacter crassostrea]MBV7260087.1 RNA polymerase subunit sigma-24 [Erythrobacter crassostrea]